MSKHAKTLASNEAAFAAAEKKADAAIKQVRQISTNSTAGMQRLYVKKEQ